MREVDDKYNQKPKFGQRDIHVTRITNPLIGQEAISVDQTNGTPLNTASTLVARDASGNFAANVITAQLTGTASGNESPLTFNAPFSRSTNTISLGTFSSDITFGSGVDINTNTTTGTQIATTTSQKLAFHGATAVIQRSGASQVAVATTSATNITPYGYTTAAQADAIITLLNEIRATLVEKGIMAGS